MVPTAFAANGTNTSAETTVLNVESGIDKKLEIPLKLDAEYDVFYNCKNINPGDTMKATVTFTNPTSTEVQVSVADVINQLSEDPKATALLEELDLTISFNGSPVFKDKHNKVTTPVTGWMILKPKEKLDMNIEIYFPKEADNRFQNVDMNVKWVFEARADVPPDPTDPPEPPEETETGDSTNHNYGLYVLMAAAAVAAIAVTMTIVNKKRKSKDQ